MISAMTILDLDQLATVTGGRGAQQSQDPQAQPQPGDTQQNGWVAGLDQFLALFQSESFQQILGGLRGILGSFAQPQQTTQPDAAAQ